MTTATRFTDMIVTITFGCNVVSLCICKHILLLLINVIRFYMHNRYIIKYNYCSGWLIIIRKKESTLTRAHARFSALCRACLITVCIGLLVLLFYFILFFFSEEGPSYGLFSVPDNNRDFSSDISMYIRLLLSRIYYIIGRYTIVLNDGN